MLHTITHKALALLLMVSALPAMAVDVKWDFQSGRSGQTATVSEQNVIASELVKAVGLSYQGTVKVGSTTLTKMQPAVQTSSASASACMRFILIPRAGITFTPTKVSFDCCRCGTNGGNIGYAIQSGTAEEKQLATGIKPNRNNESATTQCQSDVTGVEATSHQPLSLIIYVYNLSTAKQVGLANIVIEGTATGTAGESTLYSVKLKISPEGAAIVSQDPEGDSFVGLTPLTFTVKANDGYRFIDWQDGQGNTLSTLKSIDLTLTTDTTLVAHCFQLPVMDRGCYDFIVPDDGTVKDAIAAANNRADASKRYRIFIRPGDHQMPASQTETSRGSDGVDYPSPNNYVEKSNVSFIGLDYKTTSFRNTLPQVYLDGKYGKTHPLEGNYPDALTIRPGVSNTYFQGVTVKSDMLDAAGRNAALKDYGDRTIMKDASLWGYQDTYVSNGHRYYFEGGLLRGRTDYLCGGGDAYFNGVELLMCEAGGKVTAPCGPTSTGKGYVFRDCRITGPQSVDGKFTLGRPWGTGTPTAIYINTEMEVAPSTLGWDEMGTGYPARFAEYGSHRSDGTVISLEGRKTTFASTHTNNPVLTEDEAESYTIAATVGGSDNWDPTVQTRQISAPQSVSLNGTTLSWQAADGAIGYVVCSKDTAVAFTCNTSCTVPDANGSYTVRAANEMGGLGEPSAATATTGIAIISTNTQTSLASAEAVYNMQGQRLLRCPFQGKGVYIVGHRKVVMK